MMAHCAMGQTLFFIGEFVPARTHFEQASLLFESARNRSLTAIHAGVHMGVISLNYSAWIQWLLGCSDQAVDRVARAVALAEELSHPYSLCIALYYSSVLRTLRREGEAALKFADENVRLASENGFQLLLAYAICSRGGALVERGQAEESNAHLREGLASTRASGSGLGQTWVLALLAAACGRFGRLEEGLAAVAEAFAASEMTGECFFEAELYRLKGDLLLKSDAQGLSRRSRAKLRYAFGRRLKSLAASEPKRGNYARQSAFRGS